MNLIIDWFQRKLSDPQLLLLLSLVVIALLAIVLFGDMLAPAIGAAVLAFLLDGAVVWLERRGITKVVAVIIVFIGFVAVSFVTFFTLLPPIMGQFTQFFGELPAMLTRLQDSVMRLPEAYPELIDEEQIRTLMGQVRAELLDIGQNALRFSLGSIVDLITLIVYVILVPVMVFFFLKDKEKIMGWIGSFLPAYRPLVRQVWAEVVERWGDYARGKVYEIFIVGFAAWALYSALGLQFAAFLALMTGLSVMIPYIGAASVTLPVAFVAFSQWGLSDQFVITVAAYLVLQALDGNALVPLLFSEVVKLHPNAIILAILVFGGIWGLWGVFFAIPLATLAHAVIKAWTSHTSPEDDVKDVPSA